MNLKMMLHVVVLATLVVGAQGSRAAEVDGATLLQEAMAEAAALENVSVSVLMTQHTIVNERETSVDMEGALALRGDNDAFLRITAPNEEAQVFSDGETRIIHFVTNEEYIESEAPETRSEIIGLMGGGPIRLGSMWLADFLHNNAKLVDEAESISFGGTEKAPGRADGPDCHRVDIAYPGFDLQVWFPVEGPTLPEYFSVDASKSFAAAGMDRKVDVMFSFTGWDTTTSLGDERFAFVAPEGVEKVDPSAPRTERAGNSKIGDDAPALKLPLLDGGEVDLADHKGKNVVILDFWASWCGPCRVGLPAVADVAEKFADKGVVFYGVNLREDEATIRRFFESVDTEFAVLMDKSGEVGLNYGATSIPRTVVVDKEGKIAEVHAGFGPSLKKELEKKLEELTAAS